MLNSAMKLVLHLLFVIIYSWILVKYLKDTIITYSVLSGIIVGYRGIIFRMIASILLSISLMFDLLLLLSSAAK